MKKIYRLKIHKERTSAYLKNKILDDAINTIQTNGEEITIEDITDTYHKTMIRLLRANNLLKDAKEAMINPSVSMADRIVFSASIDKFLEGE